MGDHHRGTRGIQLQQDVHRAAILEGTAGLQVLALEEHFAANARVEFGRLHDGCAHHVRADAGGSGHDIAKLRDAHGQPCV